MSVECITWAFNQTIRPATSKFLLLALADCANHLGEAFPSIHYLELKTSLDRKTVIDGLKQLLDEGLIVDTLDRKGTTKQVRVFRLNGIPGAANHHYVYRVSLSATGEFYIGVRSSLNTPETDPYLGSGVWPRCVKNDGGQLEKTILATFSTRKEAEAYEATLISEMIKDPLCRNQGIPNSVSFNNQRLPIFPPKTPNFPTKDSQKRDTEPSEDPSGNKESGRVEALACPPRAGRRPRDLNEALARASMVGMLEQDCRDWFRDCEAAGWERGDGTPFDNWVKQMCICRDKLAERRAKVGSVVGGIGQKPGSSKPVSIMDLKTIIQIKEDKAKILKDKYSVEGPVSTDWRDPIKRDEWKTLRKEIRELKERIERMA